jgi:hypothetical protein
MILCGVSEKWQFSSDRRARYDEYDQNFRSFIAQGIARRTGQSISEIVSHFEERILFEEGSSDVPGTGSVNITYRSNRRLIQVHRRYDANSLTKWIRKLGFIVEFERLHLLSGDAIGHIVLRLRRA